MKEFVLVVVALLPLLSCHSPEINTKPNAKTPAESRNSAPEFQLENVAGGTTQSGDLRGSVSVIDIWATWCEPCISEIPRFNQLYNEYKNENVRVVGITVLSPHDDIARKVNELQMKYLVLVGNDQVVDGFGGVIGWPTTFVLTKDWKIYKKYIGALPDKDARIKNDIKTLLSES